MIIYVAPKERGKEFCELCRSYKLNKVIEIDRLLKYGFRKMDERYFFFKTLEPKSYEIEFHINIDDGEISSMALIDDEFVQPTICDDDRLRQVREILSDLEKKGLIIKS